jgi:drug/metabolite transporter (DMT)-like permease
MQPQNHHHLIRQATFLALTTAIISGVSNFLNKSAVSALQDPLIFTTLKNALVAMFLIGVILTFKKWHEIKSLSKKQALQLIAIGIIGGSIPFILFFTGLTKTTALNAGLIHKTLFLWVALLGLPILKERLTFLQWLGIGILFAANLFVGGFTGFKYNLGELMILSATILWAVENIIAKIALKNISSITVAGARMMIGSLILFLLIFWRGYPSVIVNLTLTQWAWVGLTGLLLFGYVLTWYSALQKAPATYVTTLLVPATLVTNLLSAIFVTHTLTVLQVISGLLFIAGTVLVILFMSKALTSKHLVFNDK